MFASLDNKLVAIERFVAALSLLSLLLLSLLQILTRNFFDTGFPQIELLNRQLLIVAGLMGAGIATSQARHIKIDALNAILSERAKYWLRIPLLLFGALVAATLSYHSINFCLDEWQYAPSNERWALPFLVAYPVSFAAISLHFLFACFQQEQT